MTYQAMLCQRKMCDLSRDGLSSWPERLQLVVDFGAHVDGLEQQIGSSCVPIHMLIVSSGRKIHRSLQLLLRRPPYRQSTSSIPPWDSFDIMLAAIEVLELHIEPPSQELIPWAWKNWVQWHALAVLLAEMSTRPFDTHAERAFQIASGAFHHYARIVADSQSGMLWKPIARLMRRVQDMRQGIGVPKAGVSHHVHSIPQRDAIMVPNSLAMDASLLTNFRAVEPSASSIDERVVEDLTDHGFETLTTGRNQQPWLAWDEFLENIMDTSGWD